jgi:hypothetical protein
MQASPDDSQRYAYRASSGLETIVVPEGTHLLASHAANDYQCGLVAVRGLARRNSAGRNGGSAMKSFTNRHLLIVAVLLLASISANVTLQLRVGQLQRQLATLTQTQYGMTRTEGDEAPPIEAKTLSGGKAVIDPRSSPRQTVIYVFAPECPWCARNLPNVAALAAASKGHFRLVGIALRADGVQVYVVKLIRTTEAPSQETIPAVVPHHTASSDSLAGVRRASAA